MKKLSQQKNAERLRAMRADLGITQAAFAKRLDFSAGTLSRAENDGFDSRTKSGRVFAKALLAHAVEKMKPKTQKAKAKPKAKTTRAKPKAKALVRAKALSLAEVESRTKTAQGFRATVEKPKGTAPARLPVAPEPVVPVLPPESGYVALAQVEAIVEAFLRTSQATFVAMLESRPSGESIAQCVERALRVSVAREAASPTATP